MKRECGTKVDLRSHAHDVRYCLAAAVEFDLMNRIEPHGADI